MTDYVLIRYTLNGLTYRIQVFWESHESLVSFARRVHEIQEYITSIGGTEQQVTFGSLDV